MITERLPLRFPALCFEKGTGAIWVTRDWDQMTNVNPFHTGVLDGTIVVDSNSNAVTIRTARKPKRKEFLWWLIRLPYRGFSADLDFEDDFGPCDLDKVKRLVIDAFSLDLDFWEEREDFGTMPERVRRARSIEELMWLFS